MVSVCRSVCVSRQTFKPSQGLCLMQDGAASHTAHMPDFEPFALPWSSKSSDQLSIIEMSSVGWQGDGALPI